MRYGWTVLFFIVVASLFLLAGHYFTSTQGCISNIAKTRHQFVKQGTEQETPFLIIVAEARSGSTWLGSFFKENENVMHFFEPLDERVFSKVVNVSAVSEHELTAMKLNVLSNECKCNFKDVKYPAMGVIPSWSKSLHRLQGFLAEDGSVLPAFRKPKSEDLAARLKAKAPTDLRTVEELCEDLDLVSAKVIRLSDISVLERLTELGCSNFKILHLVRDPRPILQSRMKTFGELHTGNGAKSSEFQESDIRFVSRGICASYLHNLDVGRSLAFHRKYRVVKYEDIASDPINYGREIYKFVGLAFTPEVEQHILRSSSGSIVQGKYEVVRNTAQVVDNWRKTMDPKHARIVEQECQKMFETFGYTKLDEL